MVCGDLTDAETYAQDCLGFIPDKVVSLHTADASTAHCEFTDTTNGITKVYEFIDWGNWRSTIAPPDLVPCPIPKEPVGLGPDFFDDEEPVDTGEEIEISLCVEKIEQWQRNPRIMFFNRVQRAEETFMSSLANLVAERLRISLSKQRRGLRGGVGTRRVNLAGRDTIKDAIIQTIHSRRYQNIHLARAGSRVALCFTTRSGRTHFLSSNGYKKLLRQLILERRSLK